MIYIYIIIYVYIGSKEAVLSINNAFKNFVVSSLHSGMYKKNKLRVYRELKEDFD